MYLHRYLQVFTSLLPSGAATIPPSYTIDVHSHIVPDFYREAMINSGYELRNGTLWADGTPIPEWTIQEHLASMDANKIDYSVLSISAPGVAFLHGNPIAVELSRRVNDYMHNLTLLHPNRFGAFCLLPLPDVKAALVEIDYCMDELNFAGVGLFTNHDGHYLGDGILDPVLERLNERKIPAFVHPTVPSCWHTVSHGHVPPMLEFPFDTTRAIVNLFFSGARKRFSNFPMVFCHGGGVLPYLADRIASLSAIPRFGGVDRKEVKEQFRSYYFDLASATSGPQLAALKEFVGAEKLVAGTDFPFVPGSDGKVFIEGFQNDNVFTDAEIKRIKRRNVLGILPRIGAKIGASGFGLKGLGTGETPRFGFLRVRVREFPKLSRGVWWVGLFSM